MHHHGTLGSLRHPTWALLVAGAALLTGCVQGELRTTVRPDGSGSLAIAASYRLAAWPPFLGDPLEGFDEVEELRGFTGPGFVAWSRPEITVESGVRRYSTEVFFDDINDVRFFAGRGDARREVLRFEQIGPRSIRLVENLEDLLDRPLPLPSPERVGMKGVSISPALMDGIRSQIGQIIRGFRLEFSVQMPGPVRRADGMENVQGQTAGVLIDDERAARAFAESAGLLLDAESLLSGDARWEWGEAIENAEEERAFPERRAAADRWWRSESR